MHSWRVIALGLSATVLGSGCAMSEYKATTARVDLQNVGYSVTQADCVMRGLHDFYAKRYVDQQFDRTQRSSAINPKEVELYVRNKFAGQDRADRGELTATRNIVARCRA